MTTPNKEISNQAYTWSTDVLLSDLTTCPQCGFQLSTTTPRKCPICAYPYLRASDREKLRRSWRRHWLHSIFEFASPQLQRMSWIEGPSATWPEGEVWVSSFAECMCSYFGDLAFDAGFESLIRDGVISPEEVFLTISFHELADGYEGIGDDRTILIDGEWKIVVREAARAWNLLKQHLSDPTDQAIIKALEKRFGVITEQQEPRNTNT